MACRTQALLRARDLLAQRLEAALAEMEHERTLHRRELRRQARMLQEVRRRFVPFHESPLSHPLHALAFNIRASASRQRGKGGMQHLLVSCGVAHPHVLWQQVPVLLLRCTQHLNCALPCTQLPQTQAQDELQRSQALAHDLRLKLKAASEELARNRGGRPGVGSAAGSSDVRRLSDSNRCGDASGGLQVVKW